MLLKNERLPRHKLSIGGLVVETDDNGSIEVSDRDVVIALLASGFVKEMPKPEPESKPILSQESEHESKPTRSKKWARELGVKNDRVCQ